MWACQAYCAHTNHCAIGISNLCSRFKKFLVQGSALKLVFQHFITCGNKPGRTSWSCFASWHRSLPVHEQGGADSIAARVWDMHSGLYFTFFLKEEGKDHMNHACGMEGGVRSCCSTPVACSLGKHLKWSSEMCIFIKNLYTLWLHLLGLEMVHRNTLSRMASLNFLLVWAFCSSKGTAECLPSSKTA